MADASDLLNALSSIPGRIQRITASTVFAVHKNRIFGEGKAADETDIGKYDTKEAWYNPDDFPKKFQPQGKDGDTGPVGDKPRKTKYFEDGYKGVRKATGRRNDKVDLRMTGTMEQSFQQQLDGKDVIYGFTFKQQAKKAEGNEKRFGKKIFKLSKRELEIIPRVFAEENI